MSDLTPAQRHKKKYRASAKGRATEALYKQRPYVKKKQAAYDHYQYTTNPIVRARKDHVANRCRMKTHYGVSPDEARWLLWLQGNKCACCGRPSNKWHTDHDHALNLFRGILCCGCNTFIGRIEANPERHQQAMTYAGVAYGQS